MLWAHFRMITFPFLLPESEKILHCSLPCEPNGTFGSKTRESVGGPIRLVFQEVLFSQAYAL